MLVILESTITLVAVQIWCFWWYSIQFVRDKSGSKIFLFQLFKFPRMPTNPNKLPQLQSVHNFRQNIGRWLRKH